MRITLQIENADRLETGGQVSYSCADRGFDIGRHEHLDWSLPDPHRVISGKHCEVRFEGGSFVLYDVSTNGTFLNGNPNRMDRPHALKSGDRLMIGDFIIAVSLEAASHPVMDQPPEAPGFPAASAGVWQTPQAAASASPAPSWPSDPSASTPPPSPAAQPAGVWGTPSVGIEGRHAPPSQAPGLGTPADDVWSQQGHGWGTSDPALYDPQARPLEREQARPAQADPLDHLASQPDLHMASEPAFPSAPPPSPDPEKHEQALPGAAHAEGRPSEPLFGMPNLGTPSEADQAADVGSPPAQQDASPFPAATVWQPAQADLEPAFPAAASKVPVKNEPDPQTSGTPQDKAEPELSIRPDGSAQTDGPGAETADFLKAFAEGAGIPESVLAGRDPEAFARDLGSILQHVTGDLMGLLQARSQVKAMTRNANRTLIARSGNNALKFSPTPQMALQTMLSDSAEQNGYLPIRLAMAAAFRDVQKHHVWTYSAMQKAAARFEATLSPRAIEATGEVSKSAFANPKAKLWEKMQERWTSLSSVHDDGLVGVFTQYFTESYEELSNGDPGQPTGS